MIILNIIIIYSIIFLISIIPLLIIYFIQKKRGRNIYVKVIFKNHQGIYVEKKLKLGFSWTVFFFGPIALLFRGQIFEGIVSFLLALFPILYLLNWYYVALANRDRLRNLMIMGWNIDVPENGDTTYIYQYVGLIKPPTTTADEYKKNQQQNENKVNVELNQTQNLNNDEMSYDRLSIADLKLMLRANGVLFKSTSTKEELIELAKENIK